MLIIGCDYHPSVQQIAFVDSETGECGERRLLHKDGEAERFYRDLKLRGVSVLRRDRGHRTCSLVRAVTGGTGLRAMDWGPGPDKGRQTDRQDAQLLLKLLVEDRFPRIWIPSPENRDVRQLLVASASAGADSDPGHESVAGGGYE